MSESLAGLMVAMTRQNAGKPLNKAAGAGKPGGGTKAPAATCCAEVMVVSASLSVARLSQVAARAGTARKLIVAKAIVIATDFIVNRLVTIRSPQQELKQANPK